MAGRIGIVGSGTVGQTLAGGFAKNDFEVMLGTNTPANRKRLTTRRGHNIQIGSSDESALFGEVVVFATEGSAAEAALKATVTAHLSGKTVIDTTNRLPTFPPSTESFNTRLLRINR